MSESSRKPMGSGRETMLDSIVNREVTAIFVREPLGLRDALRLTMTMTLAAFGVFFAPLVMFILATSETASTPTDEE